MGGGEHQERLVDRVYRVVSDLGADEISSFYDKHPYPPPVADLTDAGGVADSSHRRIEHHRMWPTIPFREDYRILVAGCGTAQAARWALRYPAAHVVGIDVSSVAIEEHRRLARQHGIDNLDLQRLPLERAGDLGEPFDLVVCTGVLHHLADPVRGLTALNEVLDPAGAIQLMVYATYGRTGATMMREYGRRLSLGSPDEELRDLVDSLRELPLDHALRNLLRTRDFGDDDAVADALLNPRERSYTVPELLELVDASNLRFSRWVRQAPYLPHCGLFTDIPHGPRIAALEERDQYAAVELFRGSITRHSAILHRVDSFALHWDDAVAAEYVPVRAATAIVVEERLPDGAAAALLNTAHAHTDLVMFVDEHERALFDAIDGQRAIGDLSEDPDLRFFQTLWWHDFVVVDASRHSAFE